jgi:hypothetical protein
MSKSPTVCIIESLGFLEEQSHREGEIISRTLQLSGKRSAYVYIRSVKELKAVTREFGDSKHRYLHLSCHGTVDDGGRMIGLSLTTGDLSNAVLAELLAPHLKGRRLFISSCLAARSDFAAKLLRRSECLSVLAPMNEIRFDDAAVFWTAFYHLMFKAKRQGMSNTRIQETVAICAALVNESFRLFTPGEKKGDVAEVTISPPGKVKPKLKE